MTDALPYSHPLRVAELAGRKPTRLRLTPDARARAAIAAALKVTALDNLRLEGELRPLGRRDWELAAELRARATQPCIVTLAPVVTEIREHVLRRYVADLPEPTGDEVEMPEDDTVEPLPAVIDAGLVLIEALALALPQYPRAPGAELGAAAFTPPGAEPLVEEKLKPFAGLSDLLKKGGTPD